MYGLSVTPWRTHAFSKASQSARLRVSRSISRTITTSTRPPSIAAISSPNPSRVISLNAENPSSLNCAASPHPRRAACAVPRSNWPGTDSDASRASLSRAYTTALTLASALSACSLLIPPSMRQNASQQWSA